MLRSTSGYPRAGRSSRAGLTRRGLLGVAAVVAGAGAADLFHKSGKPASSATKPTPGQVADQQSTAPGIEPRVVTGITTGPSATHPAVTSHPPTPGRTGHTHGAQGGGANHPKGHPSKAQSHHDAKFDDVVLPAATVQVRTRPIFYVDQLINNPPKHAIALTVDDGPDPEYTPKVLRLLDKYQMQASFCIVGVHADTYPKLIRDIARAGHVIVNHSYTHVQPFNHQTQQRVVDEITRTQRSIYRAAKVTPELFRAPGGAWSPFIYRAVAAYGLTPLDWDVDPLDWEVPGTKNIVRAMLKARPNDIVLCHDGGGDRIETVRALRKVLPTWKHRGYVTVPLIVPDTVQLSTFPPPTPENTPTPSSTPVSTGSTPMSSPSPQSETSTQ
jgi:peptidoglycan/xylan/chitin deacetylase (PgdA/CDA1 family)